jgi:hypothetical protein
VEVGYADVTIYGHIYRTGVTICRRERTQIPRTHWKFTFTPAATISANAGGVSARTGLPQLPTDLTTQHSRSADDEIHLSPKELKSGSRRVSRGLARRSRGET